MKIVVATKNQGKLREIKAILSDDKYEIVSMSDIGIDIEVDEDADTFSGNAEKKAVEIMKACNEITLADDSGLVVDALNGAPGVYSARYAGEHGDDLQNNLLLLKNMENETNRKAKFTEIGRVAERKKTFPLIALTVISTVTAKIATRRT